MADAATQLFDAPQRVDPTDSSPQTIWQSGSGSGGGDGYVTVDIKEYVDARTDAVRAENNARFSQVISRLDNLPTKWTTIGVGASVLLGVIAVLAFAGDRFDGGIAASSISVQQAVEAQRISVEAQELAKENAEQVRQLNGKIDTLIDVLQERVKE